MFDGRDVTRADAAAAQHRPGVPVPGHLRHDDGGARTWPSRCATAACRPAEIAQRVGEIAEMLELERPAEPARRGPRRPTPSRRSRSAAAWCASDVAAVLFDEPLTVIDPHLKWQLRRKLKQIHHELKLHADLRHARPGRGADLRRAGGGDDARPGRCRSARRRICSSGRRTRFVGYFIGSPGMNFLPRDGRRRGVRSRARRRPDGPARPRAAAAGGRLKLGIRPEYVRARPSPARRRACRRASRSAQDLGTY